MDKVRCHCGKIIDLDEGKQMKLVGDGEDGTGSYSICIFCGKAFK